jgi:penicillin-insensitive murein DD-endopeptidase
VRGVLRHWCPALLGLSAASCLGFVPAPLEPVSFGTTNQGVLFRGVPLPDSGPGYVRARPGEDTRFGTPDLIGVIERAVAEVERAFPGTAPVRVGDVGAPSGGRHPRHNSHRAGRDVDVLFYVTDASGRSLSGRGWLAYNRFGYAVEREDEGEGSEALFFFDEARNWHFVRTLVMDEQAGVQWIFVSRGLRARLLRYAIENERDPDALIRAAYALQEPTGAAPHDDHFHVRILCPARSLAYGCWDRGPIWPWLRASMEKPEIPAGEPLDDAALVRELLDPIE